MSWQKEHVCVSKGEVRALGASGADFANPIALVRHFFQEKLKISLPPDAQVKVETDSITDGYILYARWLPPEEPALEFKKSNYEEHGNGD